MRTASRRSWSCARGGGGFEFQRLHGMGGLLYAEAARQIAGFPAGAGLRAGGRAQGPARLSGAPAAGERRQHLVRQSLHGRAGAGGRHRPRSGRRARARSKRIRIRGCRCPPALYADRRNSQGLDLGNPRALAALERGLAERARSAHAPPGRIINGSTAPGGSARRSPIPRTAATSSAVRAMRAPAEIDRGLRRGGRARSPPGTPRAARRAPTASSTAADLLEARRADFYALLVREAGKTLPDAIAEVREAVDFCRYYALQARAQLSRAPQRLERPHRRARTNCRCTAAACSPASARGIFRWRSSPARSPRRWRPATPWSPSRPNRRR